MFRCKADFNQNFLWKPFTIFTTFKSESWVSINVQLLKWPLPLYIHISIFPWITEQHGGDLAFVSSLSTEAAAQKALVSEMVAQGNLGVNFTINEDFMASGKSCSNKMADYGLMGYWIFNCIINKLWKETLSSDGQQIHQYQWNNRISP